MSKKDWAADERKLQSVYDDIQSGKHKLALAQTDRFLKKSPKSQPGLIIRAFLLEKLSQPVNEVLKAWKGVEGTGELTYRGQWYAGMLMRSIGRTDILVSLYSKHWEAKPDSAELGQQVVLLATSIWDTPTMCSASRKMFNLQKTATWARVAAWAEWVDKTSSTPIPDDAIFPPPAPENSLKIATTLLSTTRQKIPSAEVLWLHVQILLGVGQEEAAVKLVREEGVGGGGIARNWWRLKTVQEVLTRKVGRGEEVGEFVDEELGVFGGLLKESSDMQRNWANYDHILQLISAHPSSSNITTAKSLFADLDSSIGAKERAPALALLHLDSKAKEGRMSDDEYKEAVEWYWKRWGSKGVVVDDLQGAWKGREEVLASPLQARAEEKHTDLASYLSGKHARLLLFRLKAKGWQPTEDEFKWTWTSYLAGWKYGTNLPDTDVRPADEIGLAAVQILLHLWQSPPREEANRELYLCRAIACLRMICEDSPACVPARYLLIRLYRLIGAPSLVVQPLEHLKLVEIQLDTLLHVYSERASVDALLGQSESVFATFKKRADYMYRKSSNDFTQQALENESYAQITSIRSLQSTLSTSLPAAMLAIETQRLGLIQKVISKDWATGRDADVGTDTRNWELVPTLVGEKGMSGILDLGAGGRGWVKRWREVLRAVSEIASGGEIKTVLRDAVASEEDVSPAEIAMLDAATSTLKAAQAALLSLPQPELTAAIGDSVIELATADTGSRWDKLRSAILLVELSRIVELISARITVTIQPKAKNKKVTPSLAVVELGKTLQSMQSRLKDGRKAVADSLEGLDGADETLDWSAEGLMAGSDIEKDLIERVRKEVLESRKMALANLRNLLLDN